MPRRSAGPGVQAHHGVTDLGHDWSRQAHPSAAARPPFVVYLPRTTPDVVRAVRESARLGRQLVVRAGGHSSNDLVTAPRGAVLLTTAMDRVLDVDLDGSTVTVQPGVAVVHLDDVLARHGLGLEIVPDHHAVTVGGLAAVGGLSAASLHAGLFVDAVLGVEYVDWHGDVHRVTARPDVFRVLGDLGRGGVLTELRLRVVPAAKRQTVLRNRRRRYASYDAFLADAQELFVHPGAARFARGSWLDLPKGHGLAVGTLSAFEPVAAGRRAERAWGHARAAAAFGGLRTLGRLSAQLPGPLATAAGHAAAAGLLLEPVYARHSDVERFSDGVVNWSAAGRSRSLVSLTPVQALPDVFAGMYAAARTARLRDGGVTFVSFQLKGLRSPYLCGTSTEADQVHVDVLMALGVDDVRLSGATLDRLVHAVDDVCLRHGAYRYLHTLTSPRPANEARRLDPHSRYEPALGLVEEVSA